MKKKCLHPTLVMKVYPYRNWLDKLTPMGASVDGPEDDICVSDDDVFCLDCKMKVSDGIEVLNAYYTKHYG